MKRHRIWAAFMFVVLPVIVFAGQMQIQTQSEDVIFFDGFRVPEGKFATLGMWFSEWWWWMDGLAYEPGAGYTPGTNAIKWEQSNGESNIIWGFANPVDLTEIWENESLNFKIKAPARTDTLILEFASKTNGVDAKVQYYVTATNGNFDSTAWIPVSAPLKEFKKISEAELDLAQVTQFSIYTVRGKAGITILLTECWIGHPVVHLPIVFFTGQIIPADLFSVTGWWTSWEWQGLDDVIASGVGPKPGTHAINWLQRDGWSGILWIFAEKRDFTRVLPYDTLKLQIIAPARTNDLTIEINSDKDHAIQYTLPKAAGYFDSTWHQVAVPLRDFDVSPGKANIDSTQINEVGFYTANGINGVSVYLSEIWIGNPVVIQPDIEAPAAPANVTADLVETEAYYYNRVQWEDLATETGENYNVYVSPNPIIDINVPEVELLAANLGKGSEGVRHYTYYPLKDAEMTYYYAVTCKDAAGNIGQPGLSSAITKKAKGIATISFEPPIFNADGDLTEWTLIEPFVLNQSQANGLGTLTDDNDLTAKVYLAIDEYALYFAADVTDDIYMIDTVGGNWYGKWDTQDAITLYIGLYNLMTRKHTSANSASLRATEPDYSFSLLPDKMWVRTMDGDWDFTFLRRSGTSEYYFNKKNNSDWVVEAMIPLDEILFTKNDVKDKQFVPLRGMMIPLDINVYDADAPGASEGMLSFSPLFTGGWDASWFSPAIWANTWIGDTTKVTGVSEVAVAPPAFNLRQNYPNPFNPATQITYHLPQSEFVSIRVFDLQGREVARLVEEPQAAGMHTVQFNPHAIGKNIASGIYLYQIEAGRFKAQRKMLLLK